MSGEVRAKVRYLAAQAAARKAKTEAEVEQKRRADCFDDLLASLEWFVENDDTDDRPGNEFWLDGLERGKLAIAKATGVKP